MVVVELNNVHYRYGSGPDALDGVDLSIASGEVLGLLGRNGAGKSTLLRVAMGILKAERGQVRIFGADPAVDGSLAKLKTGYVAENHPVPERATVRSILDFHRAIFPTWDSALERRLLGRLSLHQGARLSALSRGEARKALLICAIAHRPELLLLDEPASGLDPVTRREFLEIAIELLNDMGSAIVFSSHHMTDVERIAGRVAFLHQGCKVLDASLDDLREAYTLAVLPLAAGPILARRGSVQDLVRTTHRAGSIHALIARPPHRARALLEGELGIKDADYARTSLEELFVTLLDGDAGALS
jgi:ABC-2 type transport system ATP-binding protein